MNTSLDVAMANRYLHELNDLLDKLGWNKTKENVIVLPEKDGKIDFDFMDKFILILKKLIIKDVVEYTSKYLLTKK